MAVTFVAPLSSGTRLAAVPRTRFRVTLGRSAAFTAQAAALWPWAVSWPEAVRRVLDTGAAPIAYPVTGTPRVEPGDTRAVVEYMPTANAGGATAFDLAQRIEAASSLVNVLSVEDIGPVPGYSQGGVIAVEQDRDAAQAAAREAAADSSFGARLSDVFGSLVSSGQRAALYAGLFVVVVLVIALVAVRPVTALVREVGKVR